MFDKHDYNDYLDYSFMSYFVTQADLRSKMKKNPGVALPLLLDKSDIAYAFEILENCYEVWEQGWYYSPDNKEGANDKQKENYAKFKKMKKEKVLRLEGLDKVTYDALKLKTYKFTTGTSKTRDGHGITKDGMLFFDKHMKRYGAFLKDEKLKEAFIRYWDKHDEELRRVSEVLYNGRGVAGCKRKSASDDDSDEDEGSPRGVIFFSGEEGYKDPCDDYETDDDEEVECSFDREVNEAAGRIAAAERNATATAMTGV